MRTQTTFQIFSSSILIVYDARRLQQVLEAQKRSSKLLDPNNGNVSPLSESPKGSKGDLRVSPGSNRNSGSFDGSKESLTDGSKSPKNVYKKLQRSHSSSNNYEQV
jgi:1D-myo-inositol-tetrakisphosphate 5-kinase/inositol-polyphosphate multikinase